MKLALTLSSYISRQFITSFLLVASVFSILIMLMDTVELLRRSSSLRIPFFILVDMVILKLPMLLQTILPFIILVASVLAYTSLARRSELIVIRSAGVSVWEFLMPSLLTAFFIGLMVVFGLSPLSSLMLGKYERLNAKYFENRQNMLDISDSGLWIKQQYEMYPQPEDVDSPRNEMIIHAEDVTGANNISLKEVEIIAFDKNDMFTFRIDAKDAVLKDNQWVFNDSLVTFRDNVTRNVKQFCLDTNLKQKDIRNSFAEPQAISFFQLPAFINKLEKSGFSALAHILQWHKILSAPFFYAAMVMIGTIFSLKAPRQGAIGYSITLSVIFGFVIYFLSNLVSSIGLSGSIPVIIAAWIPVFITMLIGTGLLLHYEDG